MACDPCQVLRAQCPALVCDPQAFGLLLTGPIFTKGGIYEEKHVFLCGCGNSHSPKLGCFCATSDDEWPRDKSGQTPRNGGGKAASLSGMMKLSSLIRLAVSIAIAISFLTPCFCTPSGVPTKRNFA